MLKFLYFLIFPLLLAYPNGLLEGTYLNYIYICFTFAVFVLFDKRKFKIELFKSFYFILFLIVILANIISINTDERYVITDFLYISDVLRYLSFFLLFTLMVCTTDNNDDLFFWIKSFFLGYTLSIILILLDSSRVLWVESIFKTSSFEEANTLDIYFRAYGAYLSPISAGIFILNMITFILAVIVSKVVTTSKIQIYLYILLVVSVLALISTASRTALVGFAVMLLCVILFTKNKFKYLVAIGIVSVIVYQFDSVQFYIENITIRTEGEAGGGQSALEGSGRIDTFIHSMQLFFNERIFLFGVGPTEYNLGDGTNFSYAHNGYLSILLCYGLSGMLLFIVSIKKLINVIINPASNYWSSFLRIYISFFIISNAVTFISSDGPVTYFWLLFLVFFSYIVNYAQHDKEELIK